MSQARKETASSCWHFRVGLRCAFRHVNCAFLSKNPSYLLTVGLGGWGRNNVLDRQRTLQIFYRPTKMRWGGVGQ